MAQLLRAAFQVMTVPLHKRALSQELFVPSQVNCLHTHPTASTPTPLPLSRKGRFRHNLVPPHNLTITPLSTEERDSTRILS